MNPPLDSEYHQQNDTQYHEQIDNSILVDNTEMEESAQESLTELPVPPTAKPLRQGRWHSADDLYQIIMQPSEVNPDVPPGDKSNCYLLVDNERNMKTLATGNNKKCDFYGDCGN